MDTGVEASRPSLFVLRDQAEISTLPVPVPAPSTVAARSAWSVVRPEVVTWANLVTFVRLAGALAAFGLAMTGGGERWNYVGLAIYWVGDILDGQVARRTKQETVLGAEFDILADRLSVSLFYLIYVSAHPEKAIVALLFLTEFMVFDHWLSNQFTFFGLNSPNDFHRVDRVIWAWLWSVPGKALNTGAVTLLTVLAASPWPPALATLMLIAIRAVLTVRMLSLSAGQRDAARGEE